MLQEPIDCVPGAAIKLAILPKLLKATVSRRRRRPTPGHPSGKLIKSFSRLTSLPQNKQSFKKLATAGSGRIPRMECFSPNLLGRFQSPELEVYDPATDRNGDSLRAVAGSELLHDVLHVPFHRLLGDEELFRDIAIAVSAGHLLQYVYFASGQKLITEMFGQVSRNLKSV